MAFNGDPVVEEEVLRLKKAFNIEKAIETGTEYGITTWFLGENFKEVHSIEIDKDKLCIAEKLLVGMDNVHLHLGTSIEELPKLGRKFEQEEGMVLCYFDAHRQGEWPLLDEIKILGQFLKDRLVVIIDDFQVPDRNFQYDKFGIHNNSLSYVSEAIYSSFTDPFFYFNDRSERPVKCVGKLYVTPSPCKEFVKEKSLLPYSNL